MTSRSWLKLLSKRASIASIAGRLSADASTRRGTGDCFRAKYQQLLRDGFRNDKAQSSAASVLAELGDKLDAYERRGILSQFQSFLKKEQRGVRGVYICGGVGSGKTLLSNTLFECVPLTIPKTSLHFQSFMLDVHSRLHAKRGNSEKVPQVASDIASKTSFLMLDEVQVTDVGDALVFYSLFDHLFHNGVTLLATSNRVPEKLYEGGLNYEYFQPIVPLLRKHCVVHVMETTMDYRLLNKKSVQRAVFFEDSSGGNEALQESFDSLAGGFKVRESSISVGFGRSLDVPMTVEDKGICYFTFTQLCENPLSETDYIGLCNNYHTVFVANVPRINVISNRNESRRWRTFIDQAYRCNVKLIMNCASNLDELFIVPENKNVSEVAFETARVLSRLKEMQTEKYLQMEWSPDETNGENEK